MSAVTSKAKMMTANTARDRPGRPELLTAELLTDCVGVDIRAESRRQAQVCRKGWLRQEVAFVPHEPSP